MKISGVVKKNKGRGRELGFPTANFEIGEEETQDGIYIATVGPMELPALLFVGAAETFGENKRQAEVYILDFEQDIYGHRIEVEIKIKIRNSQKFDSKEQLIDQMQKDEKIARSYFSEV